MKMTHAARGRDRVHNAAQDHVPLPEDQELRALGHGGLLRLLPGLQVPGLDERPLPVRHPGTQFNSKNFSMIFQISYFTYFT